MYLRMNVGVYQGEIRGPMQINIARHLIETGQATKAEFDAESGGFKVPAEIIQNESQSETKIEAQAESQAAQSVQPRRRR
jgi:hypothetical protein